MSDSSEIKWEYKQQQRIDLEGLSPGAVKNTNNILWELGEEGWELVCFSEDHGIFKRRKASKDSLQSIFEE